MKHEEILEKAIQKAIDGGWDNIGNKRIDERLVIRFGTYNFDIAFFKALWGEEEHTPDHYTGKSDVEFYDFGGSNYHYHLMSMVIAEDPIKYLGDNI